jgi:hypothetical protein
MARLISGFEVLLLEQDTKTTGRQPATMRVTAAKPAARSGERTASRRATASRSAVAAKPAAKSAAESKAAPGSQTVSGRTRSAG